MNAKRASLSFERLNFRAHGPVAPSIEELSSPERGGIDPELLEIFFEEISTDGFEIILEEFPEGVVLMLSDLRCAVSATVWL